MSIKKHESSITSINFAPNSKYLLSGDSSGYVKLWDIKAGKAAKEWKEGNYIKDLSFNPVYHYLSICSDERVVKT